MRSSRSRRIVLPEEMFCRAAEALRKFDKQGFEERFIAEGGLAKKVKARGREGHLAFGK